MLCDLGDVQQRGVPAGKFHKRTIVRELHNFHLVPLARLRAAGNQHVISVLCGDAPRTPMLHGRQRAALRAAAHARP